MNGTIFLINSSFIYIIGGFNEGCYFNGFEYLDINNLSQGWKIVNLINSENYFASCAMGVVKTKENGIILLGGFRGLNKYDNTMIECEFIDKENIKFYNKNDNLIKKGCIFQASNFIKFNDCFYGILYKGNIIKFNMNKNILEEINIENIN